MEGHLQQASSTPIPLLRKNEGKVKAKWSKIWVAIVKPVILRPSMFTCLHRFFLAKLPLLFPSDLLHAKKAMIGTRVSNFDTVQEVFKNVGILMDFSELNKTVAKRWSAEDTVSYPTWWYLSQPLTSFSSSLQVQNDDIEGKQGWSIKNKYRGTGKTFYIYIQQPRYDKPWWNASPFFRSRYS